MRIDAIQQPTGIEQSTGIDAGREGLQTRPTDLVATPEVSFSDVFGGAIHDAAQAGHVADAKSEALARGTLDDIHGTMIAGKEAEISLHLVGTIRNRLLDAFHELWRTNV